jgi:hypothetical protein
MESPREPPISPALIEYLEKIFPDRLPGPETPERMVWSLIGEQQVVRHLRVLMNEQNDNRMES